MKDSRCVHFFETLFRISVVALPLVILFYVPFCQAKPPDRERFSPIDSSLVILEIPKNPCEYAEPFFIYTGIRNPFSETIWVEFQDLDNELEFLDLEENLLERRKQEHDEFLKTICEFIIPVYHPIAPGDTYNRNFDLCYTSHREMPQKPLPYSHLELPAFRVGKFRLRITYELFLEGHYPGEVSLGKVSRIVDLEVLEPSPERQRCIDLVKEGLFDLNVEGIDQYFTLRDSIENVCPDSSVLQTFDAALSWALLSYFDSKWVYEQPTTFDLMKVEATLMDVLHRYRRMSGHGALVSLYYAYRAQNAKSRGLQKLGEIASEYSGAELGMLATFYREQIENNWERTISFKEFKKRYRGRQ